MPTSNSDGLKSADNTDDKQLMAVCREKSETVLVITGVYNIDPILWKTSQ